MITIILLFTRCFLEVVSYREVQSCSFHASAFDREEFFNDNHNHELLFELWWDQNDGVFIYCILFFHINPQILKFWENKYWHLQNSYQYLFCQLKTKILMWQLTSCIKSVNFLFYVIQFHISYNICRRTKLISANEICITQG